MDRRGISLAKSVETSLSPLARSFFKRPESFRSLRVRLIWVVSDESTFVLESSDRSESFLIRPEPRNLSEVSLFYLLSEQSQSVGECCLLTQCR